MLKKLPRTGTAGVVLLVLAMVALAVTAGVAAIGDKRAPETVGAKAKFNYAEAVQEVQVGTSRAEVDDRLGPPSETRPGTDGGRCFVYEVVSNQTRYLICFDRRDRLVSKCAS